MSIDQRATTLIERCGNLIRVTPSYKFILAKVCSYDRRVQSGRKGVSTIQPTYLFREEGDSLIVPAGLSKRVIESLQAVGVSVVFKDLRTRKLAEPIYENIEPLRELQPEVIAAIIGHDMLQIEAPTGCHARGTLIRMADGRKQTVESIRPGDWLMSPYGTPRIVTALHTGQQEMFAITPFRGPVFHVNRDHVLCLKHANDITNYVCMKLGDYVGLSKRAKQKYFLWVVKEERTQILSFSCSSIGLGTYYGFELTDDHLYLMANGIVNHNSGKSFLIRQIPNMWPDAHIVITSPFGDIIRDAYANLLERFPATEIGLIGDGRHETGKRISCVLTQSLHLTDLERTDILVFDEVHRAAAPAAAEQLARVQNARMIGLSANTTGRSDKADLETEAIFGPPLVKISYQQVQATGAVVPMEVLIMPTNHLQPVQCSSNTLDRWGLWRNEERNNLIKEALDIVYKEHGDDIQVLIMVTTVEHAVYIGSLLPDFQLVYSQMDADKRLRWEREGLIHEGVHPITRFQKDDFKQKFRDGILRRVIVTGKWGTGVDFPLLNCVVRADGQPGDIANTQLAGRATRKSAGKEVGLIVDFNDTFHQTLEGRFKRRMTVYRKKGWKIKMLKEIPGYLTQ